MTFPKPFYFETNEALEEVINLSTNGALEEAVKKQINDKQRMKLKLFGGIPY
jgi:hypothetical protein